MKVLIGGDYVPCEQIASMMNRGDFSYFDEIKPLFESADISIINLEAPIVETNAHPIEKCGPNLKTTAAVVDSLNFAKVDVVTLANNHVLDYGVEGLEQTIIELDRHGIGYVGVGGNLKEAQAVKYIAHNGHILAIINCCEHEFSIATESSAGANPLNPVAQYYSIKEAREKADFVLIIVHGGHEYWQLPSPRMVETYRFYIDSGADAVVNHHQHCYSGFETYKGKPIFYGLGNLCFESSKRANSVWNYGYLVQILFEETISFEIFPYSQCNGEHKVVRLPGDVFEKDIAKINTIIRDHDKLSEMTREYYDSCSQSVKSAFEPYSGRIARKLYSLGLIPSFVRGAKKQVMKNMIICEAHRDKVSHIL